MQHQAATVRAQTAQEEQRGRFEDQAAVLLQRALQADSNCKAIDVRLLETEEDRDRLQKEKEELMLNLADMSQRASQADSNYKVIDAKLREAEKVQCRSLHL